MGDCGFEGAGECGGMDTNFNCQPDGPIGMWVVYFLCDVPLGIGEVVRKSDDAVEVSYGQNRPSEVYSRKNCSFYLKIDDAVKELVESSEDFTIAGCVADLRLAFPVVRVSLDKLLEE